MLKLICLVRGHCVELIIDSLVFLIEIGCILIGWFLLVELELIRFLILMRNLGIR